MSNNFLKEIVCKVVIEIGPLDKSTKSFCFLAAIFPNLSSYYLSIFSSGYPKIIIFAEESSSSSFLNIQFLKDALMPFSSLPIFSGCLIVRSITVLSSNYVLIFCIISSKRSLESFLVLKRSTSSQLSFCMSAIKSLFFNSVLNSGSLMI